MMVYGLTIKRMVSGVRIQLLMVIVLFPILAYGQEPKPLAEGDCMRPGPYRDYRHCDFNGRDLSSVNLEGSLLSGVNFQNAKLLDCNLKHAILIDADLKWAMLSGCRAASADFTNADLFHTNLDDTRIDNANFTKAYLFGASMNGGDGGTGPASQMRISRISRWRRAD